MDNNRLSSVSVLSPTVTIELIARGPNTAMGHMGGVGHMGTGAPAWEHTTMEVIQVKRSLILMTYN